MINVDTAVQRISEQSTSRFLGLAPFLRLSIADVDLRPIADALLQAALAEQNNPCIWMNLATAFFATEHRTLGLAMQAEGLRLQRTYTLPATQKPAHFTLLMLVVPGDLAENTPVDCLLEESDIDLILYYTSAEQPLPPEIPAHDAVMVAFSDTVDNSPVLQRLDMLLRGWGRPVLNAAACISNTERSAASTLLQGVRGLRMPPTRNVARDALQSIVNGKGAIDQVFNECRYPIILRPVSSHGGRDLEKIDDAAGISQYLSHVTDPDFYISNFVDYRSADGLFRKCRIAMVDGQPFICHMAVSSHWMVHYVNAGMYVDSAKRCEEASFMANFDAFVKRHGSALREICARVGLEYLCIDCAETIDGELLVFEVDHTMVVHAMDSKALFPHKQVHMLKVKRAFENLLWGRRSGLKHMSKRKDAEPSKGTAF